MIKGKQFVMALAIVSILTACENGKTMVEGTASGTESMTLIDVSGQQADTVSTLDVSSGEFSQALEIDTMKLYFLYASDRMAIPLFVAPGEKVKVDVNAEGPEASYTVSGSEASERVKKITDMAKGLMKDVDSLGQILQESQQTPEFASVKMRLDTVYQKMMKETADEYKAMIDENPNSIANIFIFSQSVGQAPILSPQENFEYVEKVAKGIQESHPDMTITKNYVESVEGLRAQVEQQKQMEQIQQNVSTGSMVPEIALPNPQGEIMKLSDLRGKVVLVDFWAAWCKPCRAENPNLVRMYNEYKGRGFDIFSVSLDGVQQQQNPKQQWEAAIAQDQLSWDTHVSDLQGWESSVVSKFGFQGIPYTVLVGRDGEIIATNLRGPALEAKLKEVLDKG